MPNKVALRRRDNAELLGLMSYEFDEKGLAVEVVDRLKLNDLVYRSVIPLSLA